MLKKQVILCLLLIMQLIILPVAYPSSLDDLIKSDMSANSGAAQNSKESPFLLLCKAHIAGQLIAENLTVDYRHKTVNGIPAKISETEIDWTIKKVDASFGVKKIFHNKLNRLAGTYNTWEEGVMYGSPPPTYICEKAPKPKF